MHKSKYQNFTPFIIFLLLWSGKISSANLKITPSQLTFAGKTGSIITRTLLLEADSTIHFAGIPMDLVGSDESKILPSSSIKVLNIPDSLLIQNPCMITVRIDLNHIAPGEYRGLLWLRSKILSLSVPAKVQVKDSPFFPVLILLVGVISGLLVIYFHQQEKPRDKILIRLSEIRSVIRTESDMIPCFREQLEACQYDIETLIHAKKCDEAILLVSDSEKVWDRWRQGRSDWIALFRYYLDLKKRLENSKLNVNSSFLKTTSQQMEEAIKNAPNLESPGLLFEKLDIISQHLNLFIQLQNEIDELNRLRNDIPGEYAESWRSKINELQQQLFDLEPSAASEHKKIDEEIKNAFLELKKLVTQHGLKATSRGAIQPEMISTRFMTSAPPITQKKHSQINKKSDRHQEILKYLVFLLLGLLIGSIGYHQLYLAKPTFGANVWIDYFSLFIWGFCAEVSLSPIIQLIRK